MRLVVLDITAMGAAAVGVVAGVVAAYVTLRRDARGSKASAMAEATTTIDPLRDKTDTLKAQADTREDEWRRLEQGWHTREERFEKRLGELDRDYRSLVLAVATVGLCANAATCPNHNRGDRRNRKRPTPPAEAETRA